MEYHKIPTKRKQLFFTVFILAAYWVVLKYGQFMMPELSDELRLQFSRYGTMCLFVAGLLAGLGFYWGAKVRHNRELAQSEMAASEEVLDVLRGLQSELGANFSGQIEKNEIRFSMAKDKLSEADKYPSFIEFCGCISIAVLALGTFFCFYGIG